MTDERDKELDALLAPLSEGDANEASIKRWQSDVLAELNRLRKAEETSKHRRWIQLAAAVLIGFFAGQALQSPEQKNMKKVKPSATIEDIYVNTD